MEEFIKQLEGRLSEPLPGPDAQYQMAHGSRKGLYGHPDDAKQAGVLALLYPKSEDWHLVFIERVSNHKDRHSGQISFPGGRFEVSDQNLANTALREAEEEIGITQKDVQILGALSKLYIPVSNFLVHPYVGFIDYTPSFSPEASEVADILETPFKTFLNKENIAQKAIHLPGNLTLKDVPHFNVENKVIWGATAMMMNELVVLTQQMSITKG
ncbi:MAG: CoA pyrophosphatase [Saprospiraceae bacterium]